MLSDRDEPMLETFIRETGGQISFDLYDGPTMLRAFTDDRVLKAVGQWLLKTRAGSGPQCLGCRTRFGPDLCTPHGFLIADGLDKKTTVLLVVGVCEDCMEMPSAQMKQLVLDLWREILPDAQIAPDRMQ